MNYLVMECHPGYAVVLDDTGRFLRVANLHYEVGQTVSSVVEMQTTSRTGGKKWAVSIVSTAACLCIALLGVWQYLSTPYGSVRMQINPDVLLSVSRLDYVVDLEGLNEDGRSLIDGYRYRNKKVEQVTGGLADLAVEQGYLTEGGAIHLTVESEDEEWRVVTEDRILLELEVHLGGSVTVSTASAVPDTSPVQPNTPITPNTPDPAPQVSQPPQPNPIVIPITPDRGGGSYDDTDYGPNHDGATDYDDTDYGPNNDGVTDYNDTDYGSNSDGVTDYENAMETGGSAYDVSVPDNADDGDSASAVPDGDAPDDSHETDDDGDVADASSDDRSDDTDDADLDDSSSDDSGSDDNSENSSDDDNDSDDGDSGYRDDSDSGD